MGLGIGLERVDPRYAYVLGLAQRAAAQCHSPRCQHLASAVASVRLEQIPPSVTGGSSAAFSTATLSRSYASTGESPAKQ